MDTETYRALEAQRDPDRYRRQDEMASKVLKHLNAFRHSPGQRLLDLIYGPQTKPLRTQVMAMILDRKVTGSDKAAQYGETRKALLEIVGAAGNCTASEDADFEAKADTYLHPERYCDSCGNPLKAGDVLPVEAYHPCETCTDPTRDSAERG